jgi:hypothetical protein
VYARDFISSAILQMMRFYFLCDSANDATCCISLDDVKDKYELQTSSMRRDGRPAKRRRWPFHYKQHFKDHIVCSLVMRASFFSCL